ncbi:MAG TPA: hypothetical protein VES88_06735 [Gemmatimonadaceae bacterium]|nr:hypothetical protein [Gemmatimonadaceae bacterium]
MPPIEAELTRHAEAVFEAMETAVRQRTNETELRLLVEPVIDRALRDLYGFSLTQIRSERRSAGGRLDTAYGGVVVEYEWRMDTPAKKEHAAEQALQYLESERDRIGTTEMFSAVVCDGATWGFLVRDEGVQPSLDLFGAPSTYAADQFIWRTNSTAACRRFLQIVGSNPKAAVTGAGLVEAFGPGSEVARRLLSQMLEVVHNRAAGDRVDTFFREWRRSLEVAYGTLDDGDGPAITALRAAYGTTTDALLGEHLFALHSYFALGVRLVAAEILAISGQESESQPSHWPTLDDGQIADMLVRLEQGRIPSTINIGNLLEGDVFSWYTENLATRVAFLDGIRDLCAALGNFAFPRIAYGAAPTTDLLRDLYQGLTPRELRRSLGEFLTPSWLAQATLDAASRNGAALAAGRVLDCTCGTGTFLTPVITSRLQSLRSTTPNPTQAEVQAVLNDVVGIDINPVAVIAARMNYLIALADLASVGDLFLPVWLADSVLLPAEPPLQADFVRDDALSGRRYLEFLTSLEQPFAVPVEFQTQAKISQLATLLRQSIRIALPEDEFVQTLTAEFGLAGLTPVTQSVSEWENAEAVLRVLYSRLLELHARGVDEVWAEIIENRFAPLSLGRFDVVVGNPPWLTWTRLPEAWRRKAEPIWKDYGIHRTPQMPGVVETRSLQTSDIAVLVTATAIERYLAPNGVLAYVLPKSVITGDPANRAFRLFHISSAREATARRVIDVRFRPVEVMDFSEVQPFSPEASNSPIVVVLRRDQVHQFPVPGSRWVRAVGGTQITDGQWDIVRRSTVRGEDVAWTPISTYDASPLAWWRPGEVPLRGQPSTYTFGVGFHTRGANGIFFVTLRGRVDRQRKIRVENIPSAGRDQAVIARGPQIGAVDADLVVPAVRGRDVGPFSVEPSQYVILAHDVATRSRPLTQAEMTGPYRATHAYLAQFRERLIDRPRYFQFVATAQLWWHLAGVRHFEPGGFLVCVNEIAIPPAAAVLREIWDPSLGRTVMPVPDHKVIFYRTVVEEEAYYLAGMINSPALQRLLERFANFTAVSPLTLRHLPIPRFDATNPAHQTLARLSKQAHELTGGARDIAVASLGLAAEVVLQP